MITFILINSWKCYKSQNQSVRITEHTFKLHICTRRKLVTLKRPLELPLQGSTSNFSILPFSFFPIIDLRDEIVEFREDCHNRNYLWLEGNKWFGYSQWSYHSLHAAHWRTSVPIPITAEIHLEQNKTWKYYQLPVRHAQDSVTRMIKCTILRGFGPWLLLLSPSAVWKRVLHEVPAHLLPRSQESRGRWTLGCSWTKTHHRRHGSLASIKVNDMITEIRKDHQVCTFEVGLICRRSDDESGLSREEDKLRRCKLGPPLYCRPAWAALFSQHSPCR